MQEKTDCLTTLSSSKEWKRYIFQLCEEQPVATITQKQPAAATKKSN